MLSPRITVTGSLFTNCFESPSASAIPPAPSCTPNASDSIGSSNPSTSLNFFPEPNNLPMASKCSPPVTTNTSFIPAFSRWFIG